MDTPQNSDEDSTNGNLQGKMVDANVLKNSTQKLRKGNSRRHILERRVSPRLKNIPEAKRPYYGPDWKRKLNSSKPEDDDQKLHLVSQKLRKGNSRRHILERRVSPRLKNIPEAKRPYYGPDWKRKLNSSKPEDDDQKLHLVSQKHEANDKKVGHSVKECSPDLAGNGSAENGHVFSSTPAEFDDTETLDLEDDAYLKWTDYQGFLADSTCQKADTKVKETLRTFNKHYLHFVQEETRRKECKHEVSDSPKSANNGQSLTNAKRSSKRPDLKAVSEMLKNKEVLYPERTFGHLPGIPVGYQFFSRTEMVVVGFHSYWLNGIDYIGKHSSKLKKNNGVSFPLAVAIVLSGQYEDDADHSNEVVYTGQGGNDLLGNKRQIKDQVMTQGNLALKNNMEQCIPVRVIRGHKSANSYSHKVYTYCGLYKVLDYWSEKGISGFTVFKYRLKRLLGQPKIDIEQVHFERDKASKGSSKLPGLVCADISFGEEVKPIPVTNLIDVPPALPPDFRYTRAVQVTKNITIPPSASGCNCKGNCTNPQNCSCAQLNGSDFPYVRQDGGRLVEPKDVVFECGPGCGCGPNCINRISQRGLKYKLEVYRTENKGWAVRSWDFIPSGAPVVEYTGVLKRNDELDHVQENDYIFDIDCWHTMHGIGGRERRGDGSTLKRNLTLKKDHREAENESEFCIDAGSFGNVARFINHSCEPNLFVQCVLSSYHDVRLARIVLFASDNIPPMQELTYDYGYALDSVVGPDGKIKTLTCYCGTNECRGRLY